MLNFIKFPKVIVLPKMSCKFSFLINRLDAVSNYSKCFRIVARFFSPVSQNFPTESPLVQWQMWQYFYTCSDTRVH